MHRLLAYPYARLGIPPMDRGPLQAYLQPFLFYECPFRISNRAELFTRKGKRDGTSPNRLIALSPYRPTNDDWRRLIDKLRVNGLLDYWMSKEYHDLAAEELKKVDWSKQPASAKRIYHTPIWMLWAKRYFMNVGSIVKQLIIRKTKSTNIC